MSISQILMLFGSIGLFLYGMKSMSDSLQKVAGSRLRNILNNMTSTPFKRVMVGMLITCIIQSSSATTVMIVSFVNAGLINLIQAIGMIMGANIGTTTTAWLISLFGFSFDIGMVAVPLIGIGFLLLLARNDKTKYIGNIIIGFSLLFLAISILKDTMGGLTEDPKFVEYLSSFNNYGFWSTLAFIIIGTVLTIIIQSSSATMALTIVMCNNGLIPFEYGVAMILGENIGTTITANIAAAVTNINARRAALAHLVFNIFGVIWATIFLKDIINLINDTIIYFGGASPITTDTSRPIALAMFHSAFNIANTLLLIGFTNQIAKLVSHIIKDNKADTNHLSYIKAGLFSTSEISLVQAQQEMLRYAEGSYKMFKHVRELFAETQSENFNTLYDKIKKQEDETDRAEIEFYKFLTRSSRESIGTEAKQQVQLLFRLSSDIELVSDSIYSIAKIIRKKKEHAIWFTPELRESINTMFELADKAIVIMNGNLMDILSGKYSLDEALSIEERINKMRTQLKENVGKHDTDEQSFGNYQSWIMFSDIVSKIETMADAVLRVSKDAITLRVDNEG